MTTTVWTERLLSGSHPSPLPLDQHRRRYPMPSAPSSHPDEALIAAVTAAGLRGRGGASFPTAIKVRTVAAGKGERVVIANVAEGEPASAKDELLASRHPHLVLDGLFLAARAVGARSTLIALDRQAPDTAHSIEWALDERRQRGEPLPDVRILPVPPRFVAGEESALVQLANGGDAKPTATPPRVYERGVRGRPTLVANAETLAHLAQIATFGPEWFRQVGTYDQPGTALVTLSGAVARPQVLEVAYGTVLQAIIDAGYPVDRVRAVLVGGYYGTWISAAAAGSVAFDDNDLASVGAKVGCGAVAVLGEGSCGVCESARVVAWMADESAGQCGPCANGLPALAGAMAELASGHATPNTLADLARWAAMVEGRGACKLPDGAARFVRSALEVFSGEVHRHLQGQRCESARSVLLVPAVDKSVWR